MKKIYLGALTLCTVLGMSAQETIWQKDKSSTQHVEIGFDFKGADILVYDMSGRQLQNLKTRNSVTKINTQALIQGAYLVSIKTNDNKTANAKLKKNSR
ncbi:T9SS type A sorting domain-containing protein [Chryseobacterium flavum]|uniref:T9SS type A sorting domain-containing protein n=1 Tax=Chryseobacterium flavum TaxID=415851 RepID=UPI002FDB1C0A